MEHKQDDHKTSWTKFLSIHYFHGSPKDEDYQKDMKLPFKTLVSYDNTSIITDYPTHAIAEDNNTWQTKNTYPNLYINFTIASYLDEIWHPPAA